MKNQIKNHLNLKNMAICGGIIVIAILFLFPSKDNSTEVTCTTATIGEIRESVLANGRINPSVEITLSPDVSGEIVELNCHEGDSVTKGDLLVKIRQDVYLSIAERAEAALNTARAQHSQQNARYMQALRKYRRDSTLYAGGAISRTEMESSMAEKEIAREQLKGTAFAIRSESASLKEAKDNLEKTLIYAPISGIVSMLSVKTGERVVGTSQMAGTEMMRIADFQKMELTVDVNENDIVKISMDNSASISIDAYPNRTFTGYVCGMSSSAGNGVISSGQVTSFRVKIDIDPQSYSDLASDGVLPLRPGMSATATINTGVREGVVVVPIKSVTTRDGSDAVWVVDRENIVSIRKIITGIQDKDNIEVKSGLEIGETVVSSPWSAVSRTLEDGDNVKIR
ncbi:MAG: efflux RND transporter periplasmic adaptor subunit [Bacteroidales bacterium]|nr:efflux RND transporter periplasmic adaptor subunit [Bacteroidales bacterium]